MGEIWQCSRLLQIYPKAYPIQPSPNKRYSCSLYMYIMLATQIWGDTNKTYQNYAIVKVTEYLHT